MPDEIDTMEAGAEADARVLVAVCGWWWARDRRKRKCVLFPPVPKRWDVVGKWEPSPWNADDWEPFEGVPVAAERFHDWNRASIKVLARHTWRTGIPSPSTSHDDMADVLAVLPKLVRLWRDHLDGWNCRIEHKGLLYHGAAEALPLAVCRVALKLKPFGGEQNP